MAAPAGLGAERGTRLPLTIRSPLKYLVNYESRRNDWLLEVFERQVMEYQPDVLLSHDLHLIPATLWGRLRGHVRLLVAQIASPLPPIRQLQSFQLILSSLPNFVARFREMGIPSELFRIGFESSVANLIPRDKRDIPVSFVGSMSPDHGGRRDWLEAVCSQCDVQVWGQGAELLPPSSAIRRAHRGEAWGAEMYRILGRSVITLNRHIDLSEQFANNMRLYEATGMGAALVTDRKVNLGDMFEPDVEVAAYDDTAGCLALIDRLQRDQPRAEAIAMAGRSRTLRDHTYRKRMEELVRIVRRYL